MAFYCPWLLDAARLAAQGTGKQVIVQHDWTTRGHGGLRALEVVVGHHTATPESSPGDYPSYNVVTYGRSDLPGPLANFGLGRSGNIYVIGAGVAYHAGASAYAGYYDLNDESLGIEAEDSGDGVWTQDQLVMYPRLVAACLKYMARGVDRYASHRTVATPSGRKADPAGISDDWMRQQANAVLQGGFDVALSFDDLNAIWSFPCVGTDPETGNKETWASGVWLSRADYRSLHALDRIKELQTANTAMQAQLDAMQAQLDQITVGGVDYATLADTTADEIDKRARDNDPTTGPVS